MLVLPGGQTWFNLTMIFAACHTEVLATRTTSSESKLGSTSTKASAMTLLGVTSATVTPQSGVAGRGEDLEMWVMAGTGFVAAAANSLWNGIWA
ncbi:hypothetical protein CJF30_00004078 [Rutstroemia sp. NJR-2017a BBW]|nr:hypothetical protein CJF30_00004078 [Rutstroemia sp. NJR-2017a BBW]